MSAYWRDAVKRVKGEPMAKGEVINLGVATLENRAHSCRAAEHRLERALDEVASALIDVKVARTLFAQTVNGAELGASCTPYQIDMGELVEIIAARVAMIERQRQ